MQLEWPECGSASDLIALSKVFALKFHTRVTIKSYWRNCEELYARLPRRVLSRGDCLCRYSRLRVDQMDQRRTLLLSCLLSMDRTALGVYKYVFIMTQIGDLLGMWNAEILSENVHIFAISILHILTYMGIMNFSEGGGANKGCQTYTAWFIFFY